MAKYEHIVSLGHFCSPAEEFMRIHRRKFSLPFDWLITRDLSSVITLINNQFEDFLSDDFMYQLSDHPQYYRNTKWNIDFYHDFSPIKSYDSQIEIVRNKYKKRICRFYATIREPTLFVRYISSRDYEYISNNISGIILSIKKHNPHNDIIFVANSNHPLPPISAPVYYVIPDENDRVSRCFLDRNQDLKEFILSSVDSSPPLVKKNTLTTLINKVHLKIRLKLGFVYRHSKQC